MTRKGVDWEFSFIGKIEERNDPTGLLTKRRKGGTLDTENKNGCFMRAWLIKSAVWKLKNHIVFTGRIQGTNPSSRQTVSFHQDNIDSFLCGVNRSTALQKLAPKLVNQLHYFMKCSEQDHLISKYFSGGIKDKHLYGLNFFVRDNKGVFIPAKERIPYWTQRTPFWILNLTLFYIYKRWIFYGINF